jgi:indole-3-glycerol phosphate synthase
VLRKDFIITRRQLFETAVLGADAVLLIARILDQGTLSGLLQLAAELEL